MELTTVIAYRIIVKGIAFPIVKAVWVFCLTASHSKAKQFSCASTAVLELKSPTIFPFAPGFSVHAHYPRGFVQKKTDVNFCVFDM